MIEQKVQYTPSKINVAMSVDGDRVSHRGSIFILPLSQQM